MRDLTDFAILAVLCVLAWVGVTVYERFTVRGRLEAAYQRAILEHGEGSPEARAARDAVTAYWRSLVD